MMKRFSSELSDEENKRLLLVIGCYSDSVREKAQKLKVPIQYFPILRPHNRFIGLDSSRIHVVLSFKDATPSSMDERIKDFRAKGVLDPQALINACTRDLGYTDITYLSFPSEFFGLPEEELKERLEKIADGEVNKVYSELSLLNQAGLTEAFEYLSSARTRLNSGQATGFGDCKSNCRNALVSAIKAITGQEKVRDGIKVMSQEGYFGEREEDFFLALEKMLSAIYQVQTKKGPHIPMPVYLEAEFCLRLTEASIDFLARSKLAKM